MYGRLTLFRLELKKFAGMLPVILAETILVGLVLFGIGFCASRAVYGERAVGEIKVGIVTQGEDNLTEMLIRFVESMDSIKDTVSFVRLSESEARKELSAGGLSAAILVPEGIVDSVNSGENLPATILLADDYSQAETEVFARFAEAGAKLLTVAQAGIYAADALCVEEGYPERIAQSENYLNREYIDYAMGRSSFFKEMEISVSSGMSMTDYYGITLLIAFLSLTGLSFGKTMEVRSGDREKMLGARGIGAGERYLTETAAFGCVFALLGTIAGLLLYLLLPGSLFAFRAGWLWMWLLWFSLGIFLRFLFQITGNHAGGILLCFGILMALMLASGIFIPAAFLPASVEKAGDFLPYKRWIDILAAVLQGNFSGKTAAELLLMILLFGMAGGLAAIVGEKGKECSQFHMRGLSDSLLPGKTVRKLQIWGILWKQYFVKFRLWIVFCLLASLIFGVVSEWKGSPFEGESKGIAVGICTSDEKGKELLSGLLEEKGIFRFQGYEEEGEMLRQIKNGSLECGFLLPEGFYEKAAGGKLKRQAELYYSPASSVYKISGEAVFAELFEMLSQDVLENYLQGNGYGEEAGFEAIKARLYELNNLYAGNGSTFHFVYETGDGYISEKPENLNIIRGLAAVMIFLMSLLGLGNMLEQEKVWSAMPGNMGKRLRAGSLHAAVAGSVLTGGAMLWLTGNMSEPLRELTGLLVYFIALEIFMAALRLFVRSTRVLYGLLPALILCSCLFCPVFIRIERYLPQIGRAAGIFPATYYLKLF